MPTRDAILRLGWASAKTKGKEEVNPKDIMIEIALRTLSLVVEVLLQNRTTTQSKSRRK